MSPVRFAAAALVALAVAPPAQADFTSVGRLAQGEFGDLARDLGAALSYKGVVPGTPLGTLGLDVGLELTETRLAHSGLLSRAGSGATSSLLVPKVHVHKGLPANLDLSAFAGRATEIDAGVFGAALRWTFADPGLVYPAFSLRASATRATGTGDLKLSTGAVDMLVSKAFGAITPYVGAGAVRTKASASGTALSGERVGEARFFGGANLNLVALNFAFEAEKMGGSVSVSAKVGWRF